MSKSEKILGVSHERWWFIARLFAAWAALVMLGDLIFLALYPLGIEDAQHINGQPDFWRTTIYQAVSAGWIYFIITYFAAGIFSENSANVGIGIFLVGMSYNIFYRIAAVIAVFSADQQLSWEFLWMQEFEPGRLADLAYSAIILVFAFAGALLNYFVPITEFRSFLGRIRRWN